MYHPGGRCVFAQIYISDSENNTISWREKIDALLDMAWFNPKFSVLIIGLGLVAAVLEGVGLSSILPIFEIVQAENPVAKADGYEGTDPIETALNGITRVGTHSKYGFGEFRFKAFESI